MKKPELITQYNKIKNLYLTADKPADQAYYLGVCTGLVLSLGKKYQDDLSKTLKDKIANLQSKKIIVE